MNKQTLKSIAYVENALSFLFLDSKVKDFINKIFLYGSAVRNELTEKSDIDIFINCLPKKEKLVESLAKAAFLRFYESNDYEKWKRFKFTYPLSIFAGDISTWQLRNSITAEGILVYSKNAEFVLNERKVMLCFKLPKEKRKYLRFIRHLYGRKEENYKMGGFLEKIRGKKISTNVIIIPKEGLQRLLKYLQREKIDYSFKEICVFE